MTERQPIPKVRRFAGTPAQIRTAATFYKVLSIATGVMLLLLCTEMIVKYFFELELFIGGMLIDGTNNSMGLVNRDDITEGFNVSVAILIAHGWMYVIYLLADFRLWSLMRWPFSRFITIALGGVVPLLSFFMEVKVHGEVERELLAHPQVAKLHKAAPSH